MLRRFKISIFLALWLLAFGPMGFVHAQNVPAFVPTQPAPGDPLPGLTPEQLRRFQKGSQSFRRIFKKEEGLGPIFNQNSCFICHGKPAAGGAQIGLTQNVTRFGKGIKGVTFDPLEHLGGSLRQAQSNGLGGCPEQIPSEANITTIRTSPIVFGSGLIESIPDSLIQANENNPLTGGKAHMVGLFEDRDGPQHVGRFGWKAQLATTLSFAADASNNEIGLSNELFLSNQLLPVEQRPNAAPSASQGDLPCDDGVADPDDRPNAEGVRFIDELRDFMRYLAPPPQTPKAGMTGEGIFNRIGCAQCHIPSFTTPKNDNDPALSEKVIKPYSDFLLHDMGDLGDGIIQGGAGPKQMKTPPLWGSRYRNLGIETARGFLLLHNQSGDTFDQVIKAHNLNSKGSEAQAAVQQYLQLSDQEKKDIYAFLSSLGQVEFDHSGDSKVSLYDFILLDFNRVYDTFSTCYKQHGTPETRITADHPCAISDIDQNGIIDQVDLNSFLSVYQGPMKDCQCNGKHDIEELLNNTSADADKNGVPDECRISFGLFVVQNFDRFSMTQSPSILDVSEGNINIRLMFSDAQIGQTVEFFYSFLGEGNGPPFGDDFCLNIKDPQSLGIYTKMDRWPVETNQIIAVPPGATQVAFQAGVLNGGVNAKKSDVVTFQLIYPAPPAPVFLRGDANSDGRVNISDAIFILTYLFSNGQQPHCLDAADANDDGAIDLSDAIRVLFFLFNGQTLPPPSPDPAADPTPDNLGCNQ